jgi:hypothetical protein
MASEAEEDAAQRAHSVLPSGWFPPALGDAPVLRALLAMPAAITAWLLGMIAFTRAQTRLTTATGGWLELVALDFLGGRLRRREGQSDTAFRTRIKAEVLRPRATRPAMRQLLLDLTGREPRIIEPALPQDVGGWGVPVMGYGVAGAYGSLQAPGDVFIDVFRDLTTGAPLIAGWGVPAAGYGKGRSAYLSTEQAADAITDDDILEAIVANKPEGVTVWVRIQA